MGSPAPDESLWLLLWGHRARLLRIARRRCACAQDAEDIVSEAIARCAAFPRLDPARVGPLLTSVAIRLCVDRERSLAAERRAAPRMCGPDSEQAEAERLLDEDEARWLERQAHLTPIEAAVVDARGAGARPAEVAAELGVTLKAVESALTRARRKVIAAWRTTLGLLGWLHWRRARCATPMATVAVVATTSTAVVCGLAYLEGWATARHQAPTRPTPAVVISYQPASQPTGILRPPPAPPARGPAATPPPVPERDVRVVVVPSVTAGPARHDGTDVFVDDDESPEERVQRCVDNGVELKLRELQVVCRE